MRPQLPIRGRGLFPKRGVSVKRLVSSNENRVKKNLKRKEKTEVSGLIISSLLNLLEMLIMLSTLVKLNGN